MQIVRPSFASLLYRYKAHHVLLWVCYFAFFIILYRNFYPSIWDLVIVTAIYFVFNAAAFYVTAYVLFPRFLYKQKIGLFLILLGGLITGLALILGFVLLQIFKDVKGLVADYSTMFQIGLMAIATMTGLLGGAKLTVDKVMSGRTDRLREQQRVETELQFLKAQVNPHFLFNAINSVYFLIRKDPDRAADTLIRLSDLLRFQLYDCTGEKIDIQRELEYLKNFIALEQVRKGEKIKVSFEQQGELSGFEIAPFMLIPFVENAFKHVSNFSAGKNIIRIEFKRDADWFKAIIENTTDNLIKNEVGGIGLKNVKRRLELLYPQQHELTIGEDDGKYSVHLSLKIA